MNPLNKNWERADDDYDDENFVEEEARAYGRENFSTVASP